MFCPGGVLSYIPGTDIIQVQFLTPDSLKDSVSAGTKFLGVFDDPLYEIQGVMR